MGRFARGALAVGLVGLGYVLGVSGVLDPGFARAQQAAPDEAGGLSEETANTVKAANAAIKAAVGVLQQDGLYAPVINTPNAFAASVGGVNVMADLEAGRGVDPETFAALYAGLASDAIASDLSKDEEGRVTYKGKVVRMYPVSRLRALFQAREQLSQP